MLNRYYEKVSGSVRAKFDFGRLQMELTCQDGQKLFHDFSSPSAVCSQVTWYEQPGYAPRYFGLTGEDVREDARAASVAVWAAIKSEFPDARWEEMLDGMQRANLLYRINYAIEQAIEGGVYTYPPLPSVLGLLEAMKDRGGSPP